MPLNIQYSSYNSAHHFNIALSFNNVAVISADFVFVCQKCNLKNLINTWFYWQVKMGLMVMRRMCSSMRCVQLPVNYAKRLTKNRLMLLGPPNFTRRMNMWNAMLKTVGWIFQRYVPHFFSLATVWNINSLLPKLAKTLRVSGSWIFRQTNPGLPVVLGWRFKNHWTLTRVGGTRLNRKDEL